MHCVVTTGSRGVSTGSLPAMIENTGELLSKIMHWRHWEYPLQAESSIIHRHGTEDSIDDGSANNLIRVLEPH